MFEQERNYFVLPASDSTVFAIKAKEGQAAHPTILYAGGEHALFYRSEDETIVLDYLSKEVQQQLSNPQKITVAEIDPATEKVVQQYQVKFKKVEQLPDFDLQYKK